VSNWTTDSAPLLGKERKPNACGPCGAFRVEDLCRYLPPTTHFSSCPEFVDQGVIRLNTPSERQQVANGVRRVR
jgi:hypothetical protein